MKTLKFIPILLTALSALTLSAREPYGYIPSVGENYVIVTAYSGNGKSVQLSPRDLDEGKNVSIYGLHSYKIPAIHLQYEPVKTIASPTSNLRRELNKAKKPKIIVRIPEKCGDADFIQGIESKLSMLGLNVVDHTLAEGAKSPKAIGQQSGADILLDVSWLEFSNPDMEQNLFKGVTKIDGKITEVKPDGEAYLFEDSKKLTKYLKDVKKKNMFPRKPKESEYKRLYVPDILTQFTINSAGIDAINAEVIEELERAECFAKNKNTVSVLFKFINLTDGSILCQFHIGFSDIEGVDYNSQIFTNRWDKQISGLSNWRNNSGDRMGYRRNPDDNSIEWIDSWNKERYHTYEGSEESAWILTSIAARLNNGEIPFAKQLNNFESVKISDEKIVEKGNSSSSTNSRYSGNGGTNYYRYYNRSYWSGGSQSNSSTSSSKTTTFKEAEYIRPQDFYGYYAPLTDKLCEELRKLLD